MIVSSSTDLGTTTALGYVGHTYRTQVNLKRVCTYKRKNLVKHLKPMKTFVWLSSTVCILIQNYWWSRMWHCPLPWYFLFSQLWWKQMMVYTRKRCKFIFRTVNRTVQRNFHQFINMRGTQWHSWLSHCTTTQKATGSIPEGVIEIFHWNCQILEYSFLWC